MGQPFTVPFDRCYYIDEQLLAGLYPGDLSVASADTKLRALLDAGIDYFIDLTEENEGRMFGRPLVPYKNHLEELASERGIDVIHQRWPIVDMGIPEKAQMSAILDDIDRARAQGRRVYVHCLGGVGRTGTVIGCWLARHDVAVGQMALEAIALLRKHRPGRDMDSPQTRQQCSMVREWEVGK
ncbi:MAG: dual specificity protein phosphatase family protein [Bacteroidota bacterium]